MCKTKTKVEAFVIMIMYKFFACILLYSNNIENIFFFKFTVPPNMHYVVSWMPYIWNFKNSMGNFFASKIESSIYFN